MPYHVYLDGPTPDPRSVFRPFFFLNMTEEELRTRVVEPWDRGQPITRNGQTADSSRVATIHVFRTEEPLVGRGGTDDYALMKRGEDMTNTFITGPAGAQRSAAAPSPAEGLPSPLRERRRVMVVHGRNVRARDAMFTFVRALGLLPIEWEEAVAETGIAAPHNLDAVRAAMDLGQAVVVILTAEDRAGALPDLADGDDLLLRGQPRQNVILEAGLAMGIDRARTILVELGNIRPASDFDGLNVVRLTNAAATRQALRSRLETADCDMTHAGTDWTGVGAGGDFETCVVPWAPISVGDDVRTHRARQRSSSITGDLGDIVM